MVQGYASVSPYALLLCVSAGLCDNMLYPPDLEKGRAAVVTLGYSYITNLVTCRSTGKRDDPHRLLRESRVPRVPH